MFNHWLGRMFGVENLHSIHSIRLSLAAPWAESGPAWVLFGCAAMAAIGAIFYSRWQPRGRKSVRLLLGASRAALLMLLFVILADPVLKLELTNRPRPVLWLLFDGTQSMNIQDEMSDAERERVNQGTGVGGQGTGEKIERPSRMDYLKALVGRSKDNVLQKLEQQFRIKAFIMDRPDSVRELRLADPPRESLDPRVLASQLTAKGQVTAIGTAFDDLVQRHATSHLAGLVMFSDFGQNNGPSPVGSGASPTRRLGAPVYAVGIGPQTAVDLATELELPRQLKKAERQEIKVVLRQSGLDGRRAKVTLTARRKQPPGAATPPEEVITIDQRELTLAGPTVEARVDYVPNETGPFEFRADVEHIEGEVVDAGNHAHRDATVIDDFLRLMFVEYEPTWEWRFIKEVFHRDPLVGMRGFRTFLRSSDPIVRTTNPLFLPSLTPKRSDFLANDAIFIGDMPATSLTDRFCGLAKEFVTQFGGGLVIIAGPRFGPGQLAETQLADILPVVVDPAAAVRDEKPFQMQLTADALKYHFMQLGESDDTGEASRRAWDNMGELPWYQPVKWKHPLATVLAEHPTDTTADGRAHQPLIAIREFPSGGKVVYLGFNETWRLRRKYGELYYRQFWGQMIQHIGLSNHIGLEKRFVVATDKLQYQPDDRARLTVTAYDANFEPLDAEKLPQHHLTAELLAPTRADGAASESQTLAIAARSPGVFETEFPVLVSGGYRLRVTDPITGATREVTFRVVNVSPEQQTAVRNTQLQEEIAAESDGRAYDLETVNRLPDEIDPRPIEETSTKVFTLWSTWLCFGLVAVLMLGEWIGRKMINLP